MEKILSLMLAILLLVSATALVGCGELLGTAQNPADTKAPADTKVPADTQAPAIKDALAEELIEKIGGASETFMGALSDATYSSAEEAAKAYVSLEVAGEKKVGITNVKSNGTLSAEAIKTAGIPESLVANADSVEEFKVTYDYTDGTMDGVSLLASTLGDENTIKVYVVKCGMNWQYFTPRPLTGNTISRTYYDSVFDFEKYKNCTLTSTQVLRNETGYSAWGQKITEYTETKSEQLLKFADNKIYLEMTTSTYDSTSGEEATVQKIYAYMEEVDGTLSCYVKQGDDSEWQKGSLTAVGFASLDELTPFYDQYLDYTYFTKTDYGFELGEDNAASYIDEVLGSDFTALLAQGMDFDMLAKFVVKDGVLSAMMSDAKLSLSVSESGVTASTEYAISAKVTCTNFGTTVVEKPFTE